MHSLLQQQLAKHLPENLADHPDLQELLQSISHTYENYEANWRKLHKADLEHIEQIERYHLAIEGTADGLWDWDIQDNLISLSKECMDIIGHPSPEVFDNNKWQLLIHPEDRDVVRQRLIEHLKGNTEHFQSEHRLLHTNDHYVWTVHKGQCLRNENGRAYRMVGRISNTDHRKRAEEERDRIFNLSVDLMVISDLEGNLHQVNPAWTKILGWPVEALRQSNWKLLVHPDDCGLAEKGLEKLRNGKPQTFLRMRLRHQDESYRWTSWSTTLNREANLMYAVVRDITKRKATEEELIDARNQALQTVRFKEQFLANMSHEIRTPMNAVLGFTKLLLDTNINEEQHEYLSIINTAGENLLVLINDILDLSKIEAGKLCIEHIDFNLRDVVEQVHKMLLPLAQEKQLDFTFRYSNAFPKSFTGDPVRITQILTNLLSNAIKFTTEGQVSLEVNIDKEEAEATWVRLTVKDSGIGIHKSKQASIFESFSQASSDTTRKFGGTGLGLTIVKRLLDLLGGTIELKSSPGEGSRFDVVVPLKTIIKIVEDSQPEDLFDRHRLGALEILLVEDNRLNQLLATKVLSRWSFTTDVAENGFQALEMMSKKSYDLVVMDVQMPVMNGLVTTRSIRQSGPQKAIPIIAMTAHAEASERQKCLSAGMNDYLTKPFDMADLYGKIAAAVQESRSKSPKAANTTSLV
ncbi:MAG: ATP-binding protein [Salibacteraceae bacterium]